MLPRPDPRVRERRISVGSFLATCCSVFLVHLLVWQEEPSRSGAALGSAVFTVGLMGILLAHEAAHVLAARAHGFRSSLPWFLPAPVLVGTFGAIIRLEGRPPDRAALVETGAAGPIAGFVATVVALALRWTLGPEPPGEGALGVPLLWRIGGAVAGVEVAPVSTSDPLGFAAWLGCLLTAMNLLPFGQLDGGHVLSGLAPSWARAANVAVTGVLLLGSVVWIGWPAWALAVWALGLWRPVRVEDPVAAPGRRARAVAAVAAAVFLLCVVPAPV